VARDGPARGSQAIQVAPFFTTDELTFRPITDADVPLLARWLSDPLVIEWWYGVTHPFDEEMVRKEYLDGADPDTDHAIVELDGVPVGFQEWYPLLACEPADVAKFENLGVSVDGGFGIDQFVGESKLHNRGIGSRLVRAMSDWLLAERGAVVVGTAPVIENARAVRAYEKAGFRPVGVMPEFDELDGEQRDCLLMVRGLSSV
jgi:aminoglycoside 6'-N-acetyltransferase